MSNSFRAIYKYWFDFFETLAAQGFRLKAINDMEIYPSPCAKCGHSGHSAAIGYVMLPCSERVDHVRHNVSLDSMNFFISVPTAYNFHCQSCGSVLQDYPRDFVTDLETDNLHLTFHRYDGTLMRVTRHTISDYIGRRYNSNDYQTLLDADNNYKELLDKFVEDHLLNSGSALYRDYYYPMANLEMYHEDLPKIKDIDEKVMNAIRVQEDISDAIDEIKMNFQDPMRLIRNKLLE